MSGALAVLGLGALTMTERALAAAPPPTAGATADARVFSSIPVESNKTFGPLAGSSVTSKIVVPETAQSFLRDVDVRTFIEHSASGDVEIELRSPARPGQLARTTKLIVGPSGAGGANDVYLGTLWDDSALSIASDLQGGLLGERAPQETLVPEGALGRFVGIDPRGEWTLTVTDRLDEPDADPEPPNPDGGKLVSWSLELATQDVSPAVTPAATYTSAPGATPIADNPATTTKTVTVSGAKDYLWDLDVVTNISHPEPGDLEIRLSHAGRTAVLATRVDGGTQFFGPRTFNDSAGTLVRQATDGPGEVVPEGALATFMGTNPNGEWTLSVTDTRDGDTGTINSVQLKIAATDATAPPVVAPPVTPPVTPPVVAPPVTPAGPGATPPVVRPQALKLGVRKFAVGKNRAKSTVRVNVGWFRGTGRVNYTATLSAKIGKKTVRRTVKGAGQAGVRNVSRTVKVPKNWKNKKVTVRLVVKNGSTTVVRTKTIRRF